jgi:hypothetical protein
VNVRARIAKAAALAAFLALTGNNVYSCFIKPAPLASPFGTFTLYFSSGGALGSGAHFGGYGFISECVCGSVGLRLATGSTRATRRSPDTARAAASGEGCIRL